MADDIHKEALEAFAECESREHKNRAEAKEDIEFARLGKQWDDRIRKQREVDGKPILTVNRMPAFIRQVTNDARQNKPSIKVHPVEKGDAKTAEVINGLIRNIEVTSNADVAYDTAAESAVQMGFGYWRINLDYATDDSFEKDIVIRAVPNPFAVYGDPYSQGADSSDWNCAFIVDEMPQRLFKQRFSKAKPVDFSADAWRQAAGWADSERKIVRVAEYWKREEITRTLVAYTHASAQGVEHAYEEDLQGLAEKLGGIELVGESRPVKSYKVRQYRLNGVEVLDNTDWLGRFIPIVPVYGDEVNVEGERFFRSLIRDAKDPQRMYNYWRTTTTELVALAPRAPFIGKRGTFDYDIEKWGTINTANHAYVEYDGADPPQRQPFSGVPAGALQEALNASDDMKAVMGIHDASLGARSNETSGVAIMARQREGDVSTFHFVDNVSRSIRHTGRILIDLIPKVYNTERVIRVMGEDGKPDAVRLTDGEANPDAGLYNLTLGKYDLTVKTGPSYTTQRQESAAMLTELVRASKEAAPLVMDLILENMDIPGGDRAVKRLQAMLPPQVKAAEEGQSPEAMQAQQQVQQVTQEATQIIQQLQAKLAEVQGDRALEEQKLQLEAQKLSVEQFKAETERLQAQQQARADILNGIPSDPNTGQPNL